MERVNMIFNPTRMKHLNEALENASVTQKFAQSLKGKPQEIIDHMDISFRLHDNASRSGIITNH